MMPLLFITIACGAISGFHSLASTGTTIKQVEKESHTLFIGYGSMLTGSFLSVLVILAVAGGLGMGMDWAMFNNLVSFMADNNYTLSILSILIIILTLWLLVSGIQFFSKRKKSGGQFSIN